MWGPQSREETIGSTTPTEPYSKRNWIAGYITSLCWGQPHLNNRDGNSLHPPCYIVANQSGKHTNRMRDSTKQNGPCNTLKEHTLIPPFSGHILPRSKEWHNYYVTSQRGTIRKVHRIMPKHGQTISSMLGTACHFSSYVQNVVTRVVPIPPAMEGLTLSAICRCLANHQRYG